MSTDMSFFHLIAGASMVVKLVMLLLLAVSVASWTMIFRRRSALQAAREAADELRGPLLVRWRPGQAVSRGQRKA